MGQMHTYSLRSLGAGGRKWRWGFLCLKRDAEGCDEFPDIWKAKGSG